MRRETQRRVVSALVRICFLCITLLVCLSEPLAAKDSRDRIICREQLPAARREILAEKLRGITHLPVSFDENGALRVADTSVGGGSQTARRLISKALAGSNVILLEDASGRQDVVFSQVVSAKWKHHTSKMPPAFVVLIDFADFDHLLGDEAALKAFDVGWAFLHELDHVVNDSLDATDAEQTGECEAHINLMRRECNLPLRANYFFTYFPFTQRDFRTRFVRLAFEHTDALTNKQRRYWVMWDAGLVGGLPEIAKTN